MNVVVVPARELSAEQVALWRRLQEADPALASPFFRPEFTEAVANVRGGVYVGILERSGRTVGFFPYQRGRLPIGAPVGGQRSNYHGVIAEPGIDWDAMALVRACGLRIWDFHHLIATQRPFERFHAAHGDSFYIDLSGGFAEYARLRRVAGSRVVPRLRQQARRLERDVGPLRFEPDVTDLNTLHTMMRWKSRQYRRTGVPDNFAVPSNVRLLERLHAFESDDFSGRLTALYAGDQLAAVHLGLRSRHVFHSWFPTYNEDLARYSPGLVLLFKLLEVAEWNGLTRIDLGKDQAPYKDRMATGVTPLAEGSVVVPSPYSAIRKARRAVEGAVRRSPFERTARAALRRVRLGTQQRAG